MVLRANGLIAALCVGLGLVVLGGAAVTAAPNSAGGARAIAAVVAVYALFLLVRLSQSGLRLEPDSVTVNGVNSKDRMTRAEVLGLAAQPVVFGRLRRLAVVCADGRVVPAVWTVTRARSSADWMRHAAWVAGGFGPTQLDVVPTLASLGRLENNDVLPVATAEPGLSPATVSPLRPGDPAARWLGWETTFIVTAFALPGVAAAADILAKHIGGVSDLNEFDLPLPRHPGFSLLVLLIGYLSTALVVPIALLLLARTGQTPSVLGFRKVGRERDGANALGLLAGVWVANITLAIALSPLLDNKHLSNTSTNSHVPAYYILYAIVVSATTAINEEAIVNGYFMTRLSQLGWSPRAAFALSLAVRTSYHAYYGIGFIATIPFGYLVTRSFQKRGRLGRPIAAHFLYDVILLIAAVLTS